MRSSYAFIRPTTSSNETVFRSTICSTEATMWMKRLGKPLRNFFTIFCSSIIEPRDAAFEDIPVNWLENSSTVLVSFIFNASNSDMSVCSLASRTRSAPRWRAFSASHISFAVFRLPTCKICSSGMD
ncbi:hypothetical protein Hanom_Chr11g00983491 [Helianthus anomalus]